MELTFAQLKDANSTRVQRWHKNGINDWSVSQWALAMAGEAGEVCNAVKKLNRITDGIANLSADPERLLATTEDAIQKVGEELADVLIYLDLLAQRLEIDLAAETRNKFNATSERYGFPERL